MKDKEELYSPCDDCNDSDCDNCPVSIPVSIKKQEQEEILFDPCDGCNDSDCDNCPVHVVTVQEKVNYPFKYKVIKKREVNHENNI